MGDEKLATGIEERIAVLERRLDDRIAEEDWYVHTFEAGLRRLESAALALEHRRCPAPGRSSAGEHLPLRGIVAQVGWWQTASTLLPSGSST